MGRIGKYPSQECINSSDYRVKRDYCFINQPEALNQLPLPDPQNKGITGTGVFSQEPLFFKSLDDENQALSDL
jgi:hypothetical protein